MKSAKTSPQQVSDTARDRLRNTLREITGRVLAEVRITRTQWDDGPRWVVMALAVDPKAPARRREVPLKDGEQHKKIAELVKRAFPRADWDRAQDYDVTTGILREHVVRLPACLRGDQR